jgi:hypothetical protein
MKFLFKLVFSGPSGRLLAPGCVRPDGSEERSRRPQRTQGQLGHVGCQGCLRPHEILVNLTFNLKLNSSFFHFTCCFLYFANQRHFLPCYNKVKS